MIDKSNPNPLVYVISGPSGVGKDAVLNRMKKGDYTFKFITTVTTRKKRPKEIDKVDYHFISTEEFKSLLSNNGLLEWANVYGNYYGVPKEPVKQALAEGQNTVLKVDVQGAANIKKIMPQAVFIFILPPSMEELANRLKKRCTETAADLNLRLKTAESEMQEIQAFDYAVLNPSDNIDLAIQDIMAIVKAENCRVHQRQLKLD
jgi:guanylate kinase